MMIISIEMLRKSESCPLCLVLELMELLRQNVGWKRSDLHVHVTGAKIQVSDDGGLARKQ